MNLRAWCPVAIARFAPRSTSVVACRRTYRRAVSPERQSGASAETNPGDSLAKPRVRAVVVAAVLPYLRKPVARQLDRRLDNPQASHLREDLGAACGQRGDVIGVLEDVRCEEVIRDAQRHVPVF